MNSLEKRIEEVENKIKDIKARWPFHTPKVSMVQELEELELELEALKEEKKRKPR